MQPPEGLETSAQGQTISLKPSFLPVLELHASPLHHAVWWGGSLIAWLRSLCFPTRSWPPQVWPPQTSISACRLQREFPCHRCAWKPGSAHTSEQQLPSWTTSLNLLGHSYMFLVHSATAPLSRKSWTLQWERPHPVPGSCMRLQLPSSTQNVSLDRELTTFRSILF